MARPLGAQKFVNSWNHLNSYILNNLFEVNTLFPAIQPDYFFYSKRIIRTYLRFGFLLVILANYQKKD
ncbi:MAG: hypothetical protein A3D31_00555 [Candidatus Fluviicola riflensis]|nr:MAG: hypothetical protein CHH17_04990 [Candidatus Fluviicola riflensis]OGS76098.1 MAG: hypothetical protein A3D31_00555 [Candidatus Fluviicola riflensis]OGS81998.1 MAG: hypothetical protein A2724_16310 [Fluviicola sp. RIFCSPHIGHO2_01_FULL_43_53]OGS83457.1 MAG: hypothetical protein A3E30_16715 [Fluviicola sp. RIFCSPHIGHO2_12_FULL_43_24]